MPKPNRVVDFERLAAFETDEHVLWPYKTTRQGYGTVGGFKVTPLVHRLALLRRVAMPHDRPLACHRPSLGCPKHCLNYRHLYWGSHADNMADKVLDGVSLRGELGPRNRLTEREVREIRLLRASTTLSARQIGDIYAVSHGAVSNIAKRRTWAWLD